MYDALYRMNVGVDFIDPGSQGMEGYKLVIVPALYAAPDSLLIRLNQFIKNGGHVVFTFKSGFSNEFVKVRSLRQPGIVSDACGISYNQFVNPGNEVGLDGDLFKAEKEKYKAGKWMELITANTAKVLAYYDHPVWHKYAAITENNYGKGMATYIGCLLNNTAVEKVLADAVKKAGIWGPEQQLYFPIVTKSGINKFGKMVRYFFNYSPNPLKLTYTFNNGRELIKNQVVRKGNNMELEAWGVNIVEQD